MELITGVFVNELEYLVDANIPVFPVWWLKEDGSCGCGGKPNCKPGKHPITEHGLDDATTDKIQIQKWMIRYPKAGWAMRTGESGVFVIDVEFDGYDSWHKIVDDRPIPDTVSTRTRRGGLHLWFKMPEGVDLRNTTEKLAENIDTRGNRGYVLIPPSQGYEYLASVVDHPIAEMPNWLMAKLVQPPKPSKNGHHKGMRNLTREKEIERVRDALSRIDPDCPYDQWSSILMALHTLGDDGLDLAIDWSSGGSKFVSGEIESKWDSFNDAKGITLGTIFFYAGDTQVDTVSQDEDDFIESHPRIVIRDAAFAMQPQPPVDWVIENLISAGSVTLLVGAPGTKKTFAMLSACVCVGSGKDWMGMGTKHVQTLIIDEESGERRLSRRLNKVIRGENADASAKVKYVSLAQFNLLKDDETLMRALITETGAGLVVIDALADIMVGGDENAVKDTQPVFMKLRKIAEDTGAGLVIIHHANKGGDYRGSTAMLGSVDSMIMVDSKDGSDDVVFSSRKLRDTEPLKFFSTVHFEEDRVWFSAKEYQRQFGKLNKAEEYVLRYLGTHDGKATKKSIEGHADTCSASAATKAIYSLCEMGRIMRVDSGESTGGRGNLAEYALVDMGEEED